MESEGKLDLFGSFFFIAEAKALQLWTKTFLGSILTKASHSNSCTYYLLLTPYEAFDSVDLSVDLSKLLTFV